MKVILLQEADGVRQHALSRFAGQAKTAAGVAGEVCVVITSKQEVQGLNRRYRRKNKATDVLSFPSTFPTVAGDIAISAEIAAETAGELGHSVETELKILILHGLLHLAGYDHENDTGEMKARETALRRKFKLPLGLIERTHGGDSNPRTRSTPNPVSRRARKGRR